jgi:hypothetical protein
VFVFPEKGQKLSFTQNACFQNLFVVTNSLLTQFLFFYVDYFSTFPENSLFIPAFFTSKNRRKEVYGIFEHIAVVTPWKILIMKRRFEKGLCFRIGLCPISWFEEELGVLERFCVAIFCELTASWVFCEFFSIILKECSFWYCLWSGFNLSDLSPQAASVVSKIFFFRCVIWQIRRPKIILTDELKPQVRKLLPFWKVFFI